VDVGLDDGQRDLREAARSILATECPPTLTRACYDDPDRWRGVWQTLVEIGWTGIGWPDPDGRDDALDLVVLLEQAGAATLPAPLLSTVGLAAGALRAAGDEGTEYAEELAGGTVAALAVSAPLACDNFRLLDGRVVGEVGPVRDATRAQLFVTVIRESDETSDEAAVAVLRAGTGVTVTALDSADPSTPVGTVSFDAPAELVVAVPATAALVVPLVAAAAELVGVADRALALSVDYAKTRHQFGQPIGAFQGVKHRLADSYVALERARSLTWLAATSCGAHRLADTDTWRAALLAKAAANDAADLATRGAVAVHGAIGQTWEHDAHLLLRRAWIGTALLGDSASLYAAAGRAFVAASA
jgi:alkylation response protein AidB-like acyl-CoA dehydrogenase